MIYDPHSDTMRLASGRTFYAFSGVLGIGADGARDPEELYYGSDGSVYPAEGTGDFTPEERQEIAAYMEARWHRWGMTKEPK